MPNYDPTELIRLCESIVEDGEILEDEAYRLAEWLNNHREACFNWPGDGLVKPLQRVWADGKVTKTELAQIGRLLRKIQKEWSRHRAEEAERIAEEAARNIILTEARLPAFLYKVRVQSHSDRSVVYEVNLNGPSCTCPDWETRRSRFPIGHLGRCCKHVFDAYSQVEPVSGWPGWLAAFLNLAWPPHPEKQWVIMQVGESLILASTAPTGWSDVMAPNGAIYDRYGYNIDEDRWAYGTKPRNSKLIIRAIERITQK